MRNKFQWVLAACICTGSGSAARAALQTALHEVNTSIGLQPTTTANKWKLQTDPSNPNFADYMPTSGALSNTFDTSQFSLATETVGEFQQYALGVTVSDVGPFHVTSFFVPYTIGGGYYVDSNGETAVNEPNGGEAGQIDNITFVDTDPSAALPANMDQYFFQVNLVPNDPVNGPVINPLNYSAFGMGAADPNGAPDFFTVTNFSDTNDSITTTFGQDGAVFTTSYVPEPSSSLLAVMGVSLLALKRRRRPIASA